MNFLFSVLISLVIFGSNSDLSIDILFSSIHNKCNIPSWSGGYGNCIRNNTVFINKLSNKYIENLSNELIRRNLLAYNNSINTLCRYHANSIAIHDYPSNADAYGSCFINNKKDFYKTLVKKDLNSLIDKNCNSEKNIIALSKINFLIIKAKYKLNYLIRNEDEPVDLYDNQMYRTYELNLDQLKKMEKQIENFSQDGCFESNIDSILKVFKNNYSEVSYYFIPINIYKRLDNIADQALLTCDSNCQRFDFNKWIKNSKTQDLSKAWFKYNEQFCTLLTSTLNEPDIVDYKKSCLYTKAYQLENFDFQLSKFQTNNLDYYSITDLESHIDMDTSYLMKTKKDWTKPLHKAFKHFSNMYCHNKASICKSFLEMIYLKDLIEIHAHQRKILFRKLEVNPLFS
ncbi:hypothetical protein [Taylorella equigenitalis]|uniref:Exported protein n=2 Tax=Taylorella equigenitalis TaxID=29575 RepID=A0ABN4AWA6_9BURK|nr:hypothetical protein [Taylorella equigenitalis]AFN36090.1 putative exported protein [Taylorella equigenitalis ATCC 35865]ASY39503.1 hypothetical protein CA604_05125 [Taylorella equigenitalis]VEG31734.1 Uncharacterised protein [Taylorella equigenitalis ATCC 35865]